MSCDWDIYCVDCGVSAGIGDANHEDDTMRALVSAAADLGRALRVICGGVDGLTELRVNGYYVPANFFISHGNHKLRPLDEYGSFDTPCGQSFWCPKCGREVDCTEREHPGKPHSHSTADNHYREGLTSTPEIRRVT